MKGYIKPLVLELDDLAEGIYAASGENGEGGEGGEHSSQVIEGGDCWSIKVDKDQDDAGGYATFRVTATHSTSLQHVSRGTTFEVMFTDNVTNAEFEGFDVQCNGTQTVVFSRPAHGNSYLSGDNFNSLMKIWSPNYKTIQAVGAMMTNCIKEVNVQGLGGDEINQG